MIDLHVHTRISDNCMTAGEILALAKARGITHLAVTDHDTMAGIVDTQAIGRKNGIEVIPGIEISAFDFLHHKRVHILGYYPDPDHPALREICLTLTGRRMVASYLMVQRLIDASYKISWEEVMKYARGGTGVYKQHIMHALLDRGYCDRIYSELYYQLFRRGENDDSSGTAFVPMEYIDVFQAISAVKAAGGVAILAHPGQYDNYDAIAEWAFHGLDGIEVYHPAHNGGDIQRLLEIARCHSLLITGGSDYHGFYAEKEAPLGCPELDESCLIELNKRRR